MGNAGIDSADSEFETEYQAWLEGHGDAKRGEWFDHPVWGLAKGKLCTVEEGASVAEVVGRMRDLQTGTALIASGGSLQGIFTERDLLRRVVAEQRDPRTTRIGEVMTREPESLSKSATVAHALRLLARARFRHVPVVDGQGVPVAVLSARELMGFVSETFPKEVLNAPPVGSRPIDEPEGA